MSTSTSNHIVSPSVCLAARGVARTLLVTGATLVLLPGAAALASATEPGASCTQVSADELGRDEGTVSVPLGGTGITVVRHRDEVWVEGDPARVESMTTTRADESTHPGELVDGRWGSEVYLPGYLAVTVCVNPTTTTGEAVVPTETTSPGGTVVPTEATQPGETVSPTEPTQPGETLSPAQTTPPGTTVPPTATFPPTATTSSTTPVPARTTSPTTTTPTVKTTVTPTVTPVLHGAAAVAAQPTQAPTTATVQAPGAPAAHDAVAKASTASAEHAGTRLATTGTSAATLGLVGAALAAAGALLVLLVRTSRRDGSR